MIKTSIIMCCFDFSRTIRHMTMACLSNIRRFTDPGYEIIIIDNCPTLPIRDDYKVLNLEEMIIKEYKKDQGYYKSLNIGAGLAEGDYLCFIQPDVFVHEGWLINLEYYLDHKIADVVWPDQFPQTRDYIEKSYKMSFEEGMKWGGREAGCVMMTKEIFDKAGGWDDRLHNEYGEAAMWNRLTKAGANMTPTNKSLITHITAGTRYTMWDENSSQHNTDMERDGKVWEEIRNEQL